MTEIVPGGGTDGDGPHRTDEAGGRRDGHQTGNGTGSDTQHAGFAVHHPLREHPGQGRRGGGDLGHGHGHAGGRVGGLAGLHLGPGAGVPVVVAVGPVVAVARLGGVGRLVAPAEPGDHDDQGADGRQAESDPRRPVEPLHSHARHAATAAVRGPSAAVRGPLSGGRG